MKQLEEYRVAFEFEGTQIYHPGLIYDMEAGLMKYGEYDSLRSYYGIAIDSYLDCGITQMANSLVLVDLGRLSHEDVIVIYRYFLDHSANGEYLHKLCMSMNSEDYNKQMKEIRARLE